MSDNPFAAYMIAPSQEKATSPPAEPIVDGPLSLALPNTPPAQSALDTNSQTEIASTVPPIAENQATTATPIETNAEPSTTGTGETTTEEPLETLEAEILFLELEDTAATTTATPTEPQVASNVIVTTDNTTSTPIASAQTWDPANPVSRDEVEDPSEEVLNGGTNSTEEEGSAAQFNQTLPPEVFSEGTFAPDHFDNFTLPPELMEAPSEDLPYVLRCFLSIYKYIYIYIYV